MKKIILGVSLLAIVVFGATALSAAEQNKDEDWRNDFTILLKNGKGIQEGTGQAQPVGLAYTPPETIILQEAVTKALEKEKEERSCECMKIAIDLDYNPYWVIKTIFEVGGNLEIDQLCMCATEAGIMKAIIAKATKEAASPLGKPLFQPDEITQSNCLRGEGGLAYTPAEMGLATIPVDNRGTNNYVSKSAP